MKILKEAFEISQEAIKFVKDSPQPDTKLKAVRSRKKVKRKRVGMHSGRVDGPIEGKHRTQFLIILMI